MLKKIRTIILNIMQAIIWRSQGCISREIYDDYCFTSAFMLYELDRTGVDLSKTHCLSIGCRIGNLIGFIPLFKSMIHCSIIPMEEREDALKILQGKICEEFTGDFFTLSGNEKFKLIDVALSHVAIHCMDDTRYGNRGGNVDRPYKFAGRLKELCPNAKHIIVSVPVNVEGSDKENNIVLSNQKFIDSFINEGYMLDCVVYDKATLEREYVQGTRLTRAFPEEYLKNHLCVVGNYHFSSIID